MKNVKAAPKTQMEATVRKVSMAGRVMDLGLAVVFGYLALTLQTSSFWKIAFGVSAAFCLFTAATAPIDKLYATLRARMMKGSKKS